MWHWECGGHEKGQGLYILVPDAESSEWQGQALGGRASRAKDGPPRAEVDKPEGPVQSPHDPSLGPRNNWDSEGKEMRSCLGK